VKAARAAWTRRFGGALLLVAGLVAFAPVQAAPWGGVPVLMYHRVDGDVPRDAVGRDLTVGTGTFEAQLQSLRARHIRTLTALELTAALARGERPERAVVLTFDDGYADAATAALPLLLRYGARATFFVSSGFVGTARHMTWAQLRVLRAVGMEVACHGTQHLDLSKLDRAGQMREAGHCARSFERYLPGWHPGTYAYPAGKYDATTFAVLRQLGFTAAYTEHPGAVRDLTRPYELPRRRISRAAGPAAFAELSAP
jgi:peptidoglycan/xylan/chitin deacetylase (PgdA/CDA1 family)